MVGNDQHWIKLLDTSQGRPFKVLNTGVLFTSIANAQYNKGCIYTIDLEQMQCNPKKSP